MLLKAVCPTLADAGEVFVKIALSLTVNLNFKVLVTELNASVKKPLTGLDEVV